jgi:hypothetical protein
MSSSIQKSNFILVTTALNKAEHVLGRKFVVNHEQQQATERRPGEFNPTTTPV